jgi:hypothetical protein
MFFNRFEELGSSVDQIEEGEDENENSPSNGMIRSTRKKKASREHVIKKRPRSFLCLLLLFF